MTQGKHDRVKKLMALIEFTQANKSMFKLDPLAELAIRYISIVGKPMPAKFVFKKDAVRLRAINSSLLGRKRNAR